MSPFPVAGQTLYGGWTQEGERYADLKTRFSSYNTKAEGLAVDSVTDDRALLDLLVNTIMQPNGGRLDVVGVPRIASNITIPANVTLKFVDGAYLAPDANVTVTINGRIKADLQKTFGGGGAILFGAGKVRRIFPEWWGASATATDVANAAAHQSAVLTSLGMTSLANVPSTLVAPVVLHSAYPVTTVYLPTGASVVGASPRRGFGYTSTANAPVLVLGRTLAETGTYTAMLRDFDITGDVTKALQHGIQLQFHGAGGLTDRLEFENVKVRSVGADGIRLMGDDISNGLIATKWNKVETRDCRGYGVHTKMGIFNHATLDNGNHSNNLLGGFFVEDFGSGTTSNQDLSFFRTQFEGNGKPFFAADFVADGTFGFKSTQYTCHVEFDDCYFEGNGNWSLGTLGANIWVKQPWMLTVRHCVLASANSQIWMNSGGQAKVEGNYIVPSAFNQAIFTFDAPQPGSDYSNLYHGKNRYSAAVTDAQLSRVINGSLTTITGFRTSNNYVENPSRLQRVILRDGTTKAFDDGAIGYTAVKRVLNNADGAKLIPVAGIGTIVLDTFVGKFLLTIDVGGILVEYIVSSTSIAQVGGTGTGNVSLVKDTAGKANVYRDAGLTAWVVQNNLAAAHNFSVRFEGVDSLRQNDTGYYETQFA